MTWLFDQYERVERARWRDLTMNITAMETGAMRALATMFGKKGHKLPDLPTYEETIHRNEGGDFEKPAWMTRYEEVNRGRIIGGDDGASVL